MLEKQAPWRSKRHCPQSFWSGRQAGRQRGREAERQVDNEGGREVKRREPSVSFQFPKSQQKCLLNTTRVLMAQETGTGDMQGSWHFQWFHQRMPRREQRACTVSVWHWCSPSGKFLAQGSLRDSLQLYYHDCPGTISQVLHHNTSYFLIQLKFNLCEKICSSNQTENLFEVLIAQCDGKAAITW